MYTNYLETFLSYLWKSERSLWSCLEGPNLLNFLLRPFQRSSTVYLLARIYTARHNCSDYRCCMELLTCCHADNYMRIIYCGRSTRNRKTGKSRQLASQQFYCHVFKAYSHNLRPKTIDTLGGKITGVASLLRRYALFLCLIRPHRYAKHKMRPIATDVPW